MATVTVGFRGYPVTRYEVGTLKEAGAKVRAYVDANGMGASDMCRGFGDVVDEAGTLRAKVGYNGRVWTPEARWEDATEIVGDALGVPLGGA